MSIVEYRLALRQGRGLNYNGTSFLFILFSVTVVLNVSVELCLANIAPGKRFLAAFIKLSSVDCGIASFFT